MALNVSIDEDTFNYLLKRSRDLGFKHSKHHRYWTDEQRVQAVRFAVKKIIEEDKKWNIIKAREDD